MHVATYDNALWDMKSYWSHERHNIGQCLISPCEQTFLINIPKNASTYCKNLLSNWRHGDYIHEDVSSMQCLLLLREPVNRWISGLGTFLNSQQTKFLDDDTTGVFASFIEQLVILDPHTEKQKNFIHNIDTNRLTCFTVDKNLHINLTSYLNTTFNLKYTDFPKHVNETKQTVVSNFFSKRLANIPGLLESIQNKYSEDYKLINSYHYMNLFYTKV